jgi:hypothetical protein
MIFSGKRRGGGKGNEENKFTSKKIKLILKGNEG